MLQFLTMFTQLNARPRIVLQGWLLALSIKEGHVKCAIVCDKSWVILGFTASQGSLHEKYTSEDPLESVKTPLSKRSFPVTSLTVHSIFTAWNVKLVLNLVLSTLFLSAKWWTTPWSPWNYCLEPSCCKKLQKSPNQETGLGNIGEI